MSEGSAEEGYYFPYDTIRPEQDKLIRNIVSSIERGESLVVHAPTGLGKTVASLGPALHYAMKNEKKVLFLTSRHTQHAIAIDTLRKIKERFGLKFDSISIIGKRWMCLVPNASLLSSSDFAEYCKKVREDGKCEFYTRARSSPVKFTVEAKALLEEISPLSPLTNESIIDHASEKRMCPYEISMGIAAKAKVIVTDYYYLFHPKIGPGFLKRINCEHQDLVVIIDEAHSLPDRVKSLASESLSSITILRAIKEAKKLGFTDAVAMLSTLQNVLLTLSAKLKVGEEIRITMEDFAQKVTKEYDYNEMVNGLDAAGDSIREQQKQSYVSSIARFLSAWLGKEDGYARILSYKKGVRESFIQLSYRCLDPSVVTKEVLGNTHSTILMSGTLLPTSMYREMLAVDKSRELIFSNPFPKRNRLNIIIPKTTTKFTERSDTQFQSISDICTEIVSAIPGNCVIFFPSYFILDRVRKAFNMSSPKTVFSERADMGKEDKDILLQSFKGYKDSGAVLLAVISGSFAEGIDLPGDYLKGVVVVGLPLGPPDLETKSLIEYYDGKFRKGWDYGYLFPAFNKCLQSAGRCIRSETDRGVIVFLDERYTWQNYRRCFPEDWDIETTTDYSRMIKDFFRKA